MNNMPENRVYYKWLSAAISAALLLLPVEGMNSAKQAAEIVPFTADAVNMSRQPVADKNFTLYDAHTSRTYSGKTNTSGRLEIMVDNTTEVEDDEPENNADYLRVSRRGIAYHSRNGKGILRIFDVMGRKQKEILINSYTGVIDLGQENASGIYAVVLETETCQAATTMILLGGRITSTSAHGKETFKKTGEVGKLSKAQNPNGARWFLQSVDGENYDTYGAWFDNLNAGRVQINKLPSWITNTPYNIGNNTDLRPYVSDDGTIGQIVADNGGVFISNGVVQVVNPNSDIHTILNISVADAVNPAKRATRQFQFDYTAPNQKVTLSGRVLDVELQAANTGLRGWVDVVIDGTTTRYEADANGNYSIQVNKGTTITELRAGYYTDLTTKSAASFVSTIRNVRVDSNLTGKDIAVLKTNDLQYTTRDELKAIICYANTTMRYGSDSYMQAEEAWLQGLNPDHQIIVSQTNKSNGKTYSADELSRLVSDINGIQNQCGLVRTYPVSTRTDSGGYLPSTDAERRSKTIVSKGGPLFGRKDYDGDSGNHRIDFCATELNDPMGMPGSTREDIMEGFGGFQMIRGDSGRNDGLPLNGKTIFYENSNENVIKEADIKVARLVNAIYANFAQFGTQTQGVQVRDFLRLQ